jgi:hypothetical protein
VAHRNQLASHREILISVVSSTIYRLMKNQKRSSQSSLGKRKKIYAYFGTFSIVAERPQHTHFDDFRNATQGKAWRRYRNDDPYCPSTTSVPEACSPLLLDMDLIGLCGLRVFSFLKMRRPIRADFALLRAE